MANRPLRVKVALHKVYPYFISIEDLDLTPYVDNIEVLSRRGEVTTVILKLVNVEVNGSKWDTGAERPTIVHNTLNTATTSEAVKQAVERAAKNQSVL